MIKMTNTAFGIGIYADQLSLRRHKVNSRKCLCVVDDSSHSTINIVLCISICGDAFLFINTLLV